MHADKGEDGQLLLFSASGMETEGLLGSSREHNDQEDLKFLRRLKQRKGKTR